jgi:hypothetical protein
MKDGNGTEQKIDHTACFLTTDVCVNLSLRFGLLAASSECHAGISRIV